MPRLSPTALLNFAEVYAKHTVLNLGQVAQGVRYIYSHPDVDLLAKPGSVEHLTLSVALRATRIVNDLYYAVIPPQSHHTAEELSGMRDTSFKKWFDCGYSAWRFNEDGSLKDPLGEKVDKRWDPRCKKP